MKLGSLIKEFKEPRQLFMKVVHRYPELFKWMDDELYLKFFYRIVMGKKLNLDNPQTFNEKLQWLKLHDRKDIYTTMVDKYEAKKYVAEQIGEEYIIPTLGVWDSFDDIDFDSLPNQFVLKCTHDSGGLVICRDKSTFDKNTARKKMNRSLKSNFFWFGREWPYKNVKPRIIAEKYMEDTRSSDLKDYKLYCFSGKMKLLLITQDRNKKMTTGDYFDENGNHLDMTWGFPNANTVPEIPKNFSLMKKLAEALSTGMTELRVDFYNINDHIFFGELTFYDGSGFERIEPEHYNKTMGDWIDFPLI